MFNACPCSVFHPFWTQSPFHTAMRAFVQAQYAPIHRRSPPTWSSVHLQPLPMEISLLIYSTSLQTANRSSSSQSAHCVFGSTPRASEMPRTLCVLHDPRWNRHRSCTWTCTVHAISSATDTALTDYRASDAFFHTTISTGLVSWRLQSDWVFRHPRARWWLRGRCDFWTSGQFLGQDTVVGNMHRNT